MMAPSDLRWSREQRRYAIHTGRINGADYCGNLIILSRNTKQGQGCRGCAVVQCTTTGTYQHTLRPLSACVRECATRRPM
jgi:hypothetical protein